MWKQRKSLKSCWCLPRKVINIYSEKESSAEKIVKNKKKKRMKSSFSKVILNIIILSVKNCHE